MGKRGSGATFSLEHLAEAIRLGFLTWALPRLTELPKKDWPDAMARARDIDFDWIERTAIVAAVACAAYLLEFDPAQAEGLSMPARFLFQVLVSLPLLALLLGPFYLRRARRGLDRIIHQRDMSGTKGEGDVHDNR